MSRVRVNIAANLVGGATNAALQIILIPFYLHYLGIEAYGLVGFFATLQAVFGVLDLGLGATLNRGLARLSGVGGSEQQQRDLLRTFETVYWVLALTIGAAIFALASPIALHWVHAQRLAPLSIILAVRLMGMITALQFPFALYQSALMGLQRQALVNAIAVGGAALRGFGSLAVLAYISATIVAFFGFQTMVMLAQTAVASAIIWRVLRGVSMHRPRFDVAILRSEWKFTASIAANGIVGAMITQSDKMLLSTLLPLSDFGYYAVAGTVAAAIWFVITPVTTAVYPRFSQLFAANDEGALAALYQKSSQLVAASVFPMALTLIFFTREIVLLWTHNGVTAERTATVIAFLVAGTAVGGIVTVPAYLQAAAGWPQLTLITNSVSVLFFVPLVIFMAAHFGAPGAAAVWLMHNCAVLFITIPIMHRRLLRGHMGSWYLRAVLLPFASALVTGFLFRRWMPAGMTPLATAGYIAASGAIMTAAAVLVSDRIRENVLHLTRAIAFRVSQPTEQ